MSLNQLYRPLCSAELQAEIEFEAKLRSLLATYGFSLRDVINLLDPQSGRRTANISATAAEKAPRRERKVKKYKNPHNGELIETKGGNHRRLKEWKKEHGADVVESWLIS